jgi:hypothetical protein
VAGPSTAPTKPTNLRLLVQNVYRLSTKELAKLQGLSAELFFLPESADPASKDSL